METDWINLKTRIPQGTIIGPLLNNIYVNHLAKIVEKNLTVVQHAEDLFFTFDTDEQKQNLKITSQKLSIFLAKSQLLVKKQNYKILCSAPEKG